MKKPLWMKFIIFVAIFMITINGILPTNVVLADEEPIENWESVGDDDDDASIFERVACGILMLIGTGVYALISLIIGEPFSIEKVVFNQYSNTKLTFWESDLETYGENAFLEKSNMRKTLNVFYDFFKGLALVTYLIILVYMGIRILLGSTAERGSRHKEFMVYWLQGVLMLFVFPFVMKYAIHINNAFVSFVGENRNRYVQEELEGSSFGTSEAEELEDSGGINNFEDIINTVTDTLMSNSGNDYMAYMYSEAITRGWIAYAVCWFIMLLQMIGFLVVYFKRVLIVIFLIVIFPLVMISYALDKVGDGKSQAFDSWLKEYLLNIFVQSFHAIAYVLIMGIVTSLGNDPKEYWLLMLIALSFISKGDDILRAIFSLSGSQGTVKGIGQSLMQVAAVKTIASGVRNTASRTFGKNSLARKTFNKFSKLDDKKWEIRQNRAKEESHQIALAQFSAPPPVPQTVQPLNKLAMKDDMKNSIDIALGKKGSTAKEYQDALDKLLAYRNQTQDQEIQNALNESLQGISQEELRQLEDLLRQNAQINNVLANGADINFATNVNLVLASLKRDKNGNLTLESKKLLKKLAISEDELREMATYSQLNFKEDKTKPSHQSGGGRVDTNEYWSRRKEKLGNARGRGAAKKNREKNKLSDANTLFEATRNKNSSRVSGTDRTQNGKNGNMTATEKRKALEQKRRKRNARIALENAMPKNNKKDGKKVYENVVDRNGVTSGVGKEVVVKKNMVSGGKNMTARRNLQGFSNATIANTVKYGSPTSTIETSASATTTSYAKNIPKQYRVSTSVGSSPSTKLEREEAIKNAIASAQVSANNKPAKNYSGRKQTLLARKYNDSRSGRTKNEEQPTTNAGFTHQTARAASPSKQNPGAQIAQTPGNVGDLENILNDINFSNGNAFSNISKSERIVLGKAVEVKQRKEDLEILQDSIKVLNAADSGNYSIDEMIAEAETVKILREAYKSSDGKENNEFFNTEKNSKYDVDKFQSDLIKIKEIAQIKDSSSLGIYTARELLENAKEFKGIIDEYRNGTEEESKLVRIFTNYVGCTPDSYETMLRVKILNNPDSVGNDKEIIEESKAYVRKNEISDFARSRLNYNIKELNEDVNVKYLNSNGNDSEPIRSSVEQRRYKDAIARSKHERIINKLDEDKETLDKEKRKLTVESVLSAADTVVRDTASIVGGAGVGSIILGMSSDSKSDLITSLPAQAVTSFSVGSEMVDSVVKKGFDLRDSGIDLGKKAVKQVSELTGKNQKPEKVEYEAPSARAYRERLDALKKNSELKGESFEERKFKFDSNNQNGSNN